MPQVSSGKRADRLECVEAELQQDAGHHAAGNPFWYARNERVEIAGQRRSQRMSAAAVR